MKTDQLINLMPMRDGDLQLILQAFHPANNTKGLEPYYEFNMVLNEQREIAGRIRLRLGDTEELLLYHGHVGYNVFPEFRGQRLAARSVRLLLPLAAHHDLNPLWITCDPDNSASRKTCERAGAEFIEIVDVPRSQDIYQEGERQKCRYSLATMTIEAAGPINQ